MPEDWSIRGSLPTVKGRAGQGDGCLIPSIGYKGTDIVVTRSDFYDAIRLDPAWGSYNAADAALRTAGASWGQLLED